MTFMFLSLDGISRVVSLLGLKGGGRALVSLATPFFLFPNFKCFLSYHKLDVCFSYSRWLSILEMVEGCVAIPSASRSLGWSFCEFPKIQDGPDMSQSFWYSSRMGMGVLGGDTCPKIEFSNPIY